MFQTTNQLTVALRILKALEMLGIASGKFTELWKITIEIPELFNYPFKSGAFQ